MSDNYPNDLYDDETRAKFRETIIAEALETAGLANDTLPPAVYLTVTEAARMALARLERVHAIEMKAMQIAVDNLTRTQTPTPTEGAAQ